MMKQKNDNIFYKLKLDLNFTTSKLLAFVIIVSGSYLSYYLKVYDPFMWAVIGSTALFGVKVWSNKNSFVNEKLNVE